MRPGRPRQETAWGPCRFRPRRLRPTGGSVLRAHPACSVGAVPGVTWRRAARSLGPPGGVTLRARPRAGARTPGEGRPVSRPPGIRPLSCHGVCPRRDGGGFAARLATAVETRVSDAATSSSGLMPRGSPAAGAGRVRSRSTRGSPKCFPIHPIASRVLPVSSWQFPRRFKRLPRFPMLAARRSLPLCRSFSCLRILRGFLRRGCPTCDREFKWFPAQDDGDSEPAHGGGYFCPYCAIHAPSEAWMTKPRSRCWRRSRFARCSRPRSGGSSDGWAMSTELQAAFLRRNSSTTFRMTRAAHRGRRHAARRIRLPPSGACEGARRLDQAGSLPDLRLTRRIELEA